MLAVFLRNPAVAFFCWNFWDKPFINYDMDELRKLFFDDVWEEISKSAKSFPLSEIRIRVGKPIRCAANGKFVYVSKIASEKDVSRVLDVATGYSAYSASDAALKGYLHYYGGVRIGITGEGVTDGGKLMNVKSVSSLCIRIPTDAEGVFEKLEGSVFFDGAVKNTAIVSPPFGGKTTMLRSMVRFASKTGANVLVLDERYELSGSGAFDLGENTDVMLGASKSVFFENVVRSMNPDVIAVDEIYAEREAEEMVKIANSGIKIFYTVHGDSLKRLEFSDTKKLFDVTEVGILLTKNPSPGTVKEVKRFA